MGFSGRTPSKRSKGMLDGALSASVGHGPAVAESPTAPGATSFREGQDRQLMPRCQDLKLQGEAAAEGKEEEGEERADKGLQAVGHHPVLPANPIWTLNHHEVGANAAVWLRVCSQIAVASSRHSSPASQLRKSSNRGTHDAH